MNNTIIFYINLFLIPIVCMSHQSIDEKIKIFQDIRDIIDDIAKSTQRAPTYLDNKAKIIHTKISEIPGSCKIEKVNTAGELILIGTGLSIGVVATILSQKMAPLVTPSLHIFYAWAQAMIKARH